MPSSLDSEHANDAYLDLDHRIEHDQLLHPLEDLQEIRQTQFEEEKSL